MYSQFRQNGFTQQDYQDFKNKATNQSIVRKMVSISELEIVSDKLLGFSGVEWEMTETAFKSLVKYLGLSNTVLDKITKTLGDDSSKKLLEMMRIAISKESEKNYICMMVNKVNSKIVNFAKSAESVLSNGAFFQLFEQTMNNHSGMEIKNMGITEEGNIELSVLNNNWEFNVGNLNEEFFKSGLVFINTPEATIINPFNERLTCTNGMVISEKGLSLILKKASAGDVSAFFDTVTNLKGVQNFEQTFKSRIVKMMDTQASYAEMLGCYNNVNYNIANTKDPMVRQTIHEFIPVHEVQAEYLKHAIDLNTLNNKDHKKIYTPHSIWDLVNFLTDLSSHPFKYGLQLTHGNSSMFNMQRHAGDLCFKEQFDLESPVIQLFKK